MKNGGIVEYKCRRCGEIVRDLHAPGLLVSLTDAVYADGGPSRADPMGPRMVNFHRCEDGGYGVTDLIGGTPDKENKS